MLRFVLPLAGVLGTLLACGVSGRGYTYREAAQIDTTRVRMDGYFYAIRERTSAYPAPDTRALYLDYLLLWPDGTASLTRSQSLLQGGWDRAGDDLILRADSIVAATEAGRDGSYSTYWGAFRLTGDALSMQLLVSSGDGLSRSVSHWDLRVLSDSLLLLPDRPSTGPERNLPLRFRPLAGKPPPDNWTQTHRNLQPGR